MSGNTHESEAYAKRQFKTCPVARMVPGIWSAPLGPLLHVSLLWQAQKRGGYERKGNVKRNKLEKRGDKEDNGGGLIFPPLFFSFFPLHGAILHLFLVLQKWP
jgi:hypothetical protein